MLGSCQEAPVDIIVDNMVVMLLFEERLQCQVFQMFVFFVLFFFNSMPTTIN